MTRKPDAAASRWRFRERWSSLCLALIGLAPVASHAQLASCLRIAEDAARLACYDGLARSEGKGVSGTASPAPAAAPAPAASGQAAHEVRLLMPAGTTLEERWELRPEQKRGILNLVPYKPLLGLVHRTSDTNDNPSSPTRPFTGSNEVDLDSAEVKMQLSFKTKVAEGLLGTQGDLWMGYTQVSYWQVGNNRHSAPFRETNYEPELMYVHPLRARLGALQMRFVGLTLNHQSNGRGGSLSRSWNRLIGEAAAEIGPWSIHVRPWTRVFESKDNDNDNPDIADFAGRGELALVYRSGRQVVTLTGRHSLKSGDRSHGSGQLDWAFPLVGGLNGHVQLFSGYGQNLLDYNHRQTTIGLGVSFFD